MAIRTTIPNKKLVELALMLRVMPLIHWVVVGERVFFDFVLVLERSFSFFLLPGLG